MTDFAIGAITFKTKIKMRLKYLIRRFRGSFLVAFLLFEHDLISAQCVTKISIEQQQLFLKGCLTSSAFENFKELYAKNPVSELIVQSEGGSVISGLDFAEFIKSKKIKLIVRGYCYSSCANYLLGAADDVVLENGSIIGFHGDARLSVQRAETDLSLSDEAKLAIRQIAAREEKLAEQIPKIQYIHELQRLITGESESKFVVYTPMGQLMCRGLGIVEWLPSSSTAKRLLLVSSTAEHRFEGEDEFGYILRRQLLLRRSLLDIDPLRDCTKIE